MDSVHPALPSAAPTSRGRIACVGLGMTLGSHLTPVARSAIAQADVVFAALSDAIVELWLQRMHPDVRSLQPYYAEGKSRRQTYREWVEVMLEPARNGRKVCAVFYGHPGIFAWSPHQLIALARGEGVPAYMEPGISAEDCLYADLGIDPGQFGCQHFEASQLLFYRRRIDPGAYLVLWQVALVGDLSLKRFTTGAEYRRLLVERLAEHYPAEHRIIVYRCATLPIFQPKIRHIALHELPELDMAEDETVVVPPAESLQPDPQMRARLLGLDARLAKSQGTFERGDSVRGEPFVFAQDRPVEP